MIIVMGMNVIGDCVKNGIGVPQDEAKATEWYETAAAAAIGRTSDFF